MQFGTTAVTWLRTSPSALPRATRAVRRRVAQFQAVRTSGSISQHLDAIVRTTLAESADPTGR